MITNGLLLTKDLIDFMLEYKNFKVLSISIDNEKNTIRKQANIQENKWDEKWSHVEDMMLYFQKRKKDLNYTHCNLDSKTVVLDENASDLLKIHKYCVENLQCDTHAFQFLKELISGVDLYTDTRILLPLYKYHPMWCLASICTIFAPYYVQYVPFANYLVKG